MLAGSVFSHNRGDRAVVAPSLGTDLLKLLAWLQLILFYFTMTLIPGHMVRMAIHLRPFLTFVLCLILSSFSSSRYFSPCWLLQISPAGEIGGKERTKASPPPSYLSA